MSESKGNNASGGSCGCGCFGIVLFLVSLSFFIQFLANCKGRTILESAVQTTHDFYEVTDSVWNKKN